MSQSSALLSSCIVVLVVQLIAGANFQDESRMKQWPCPIKHKISPCVCTSDENYNLFLDCSNVENSQQLARAFKHPFPFNKFSSLLIDQTDCVDCHLTSLPAGVLGKRVNFGEITIKGTKIEVIEDNVFSASYNTLTTLRLTSNKIRSFPFESLQKYSTLRYLHLNRNQFDKSNPIPDIISKQLRIINLSSNGLTVSPELVTKSPSVRQVRLRNARLTQIPVYDTSPISMFSGLQYVELVDFGMNFITEVRSHTIVAAAATFKTVDLSQNRISVLHPAFVTGFSTDESSTLNMSKNSLTSLDQIIWEGILKELPYENSVDISENPIICDCGLAWLAQNPQRTSLTNSTTCQDGAVIKYLSANYFESCETQ